MQDLKNRVAIVTGSTKGIGHAIAKSLLKSGAKVVISGRVEADCTRVAKDLSASGDAFGVACDVRDREEVDALFAAAEKKFGGVDILINNAGLGEFKAVAEMTDEEWSAVIDTNLTGVFYASRAGVHALRKRGGGAIVNIGSLAGKQAFPKAAAYCASKYGLLGFSEALMQEVRHDHIRVCCVMPGSVDTDFGGPGKDRQAWKLQGEDVADVVLMVLQQNPRALASRIELRPSEPPQKG